MKRRSTIDTFLPAGIRPQKPRARAGRAMARGFAARFAARLWFHRQSAAFFACNNSIPSEKAASNFYDTVAAVPSPQN